ncbi:MAG: hypothetical protein QNJ16_14530 [Rhodobacter sp.]|nr:hypothetical protein [Rhodobacter sp.]
MPKDPEIVFHIGAPHPDFDQLTWSLRKDTDVLADHGVLLRRPSGYRATVDATLDKLAGGPATEQDQQALLNGILRNYPAKRLILSNSAFLGEPVSVPDGDRLFPRAGDATKALRNLFPDHACRFCLAIENPAAIVAKAVQSQTEAPPEDFFENLEARGLRWSDVIDRIRAQNPDCRITVWRIEDAPHSWPAILSAVTEISTPAGFSGDLDIIEKMISKDEFSTLSGYLAGHSDMPNEHRGKVKKIFLKYFRKQDAAWDEIDLPGWTSDIVETMTRDYDDDIKGIQEVPGVDLICA